jgi:hypothetical protein
MYMRSYGETEEHMHDTVGDLCQFDEFEKVRRICTYLFWESALCALMISFRRYSNCFAPLAKNR